MRYRRRLPLRRKRKFRKFLSRVKAPSRRLVSVDRPLKKIHVKYFKASKDIDFDWYFGKGSYDKSLQHIDYGSAVLNGLEVAYYKNFYESFMVNKVVVVLDRFDCQQYDMIYNKLQGVQTTATNPNAYVAYYSDTDPGFITGGAIPGTTFRACFLKDIAKVKSDMPDVTSVDSCNNIIVKNLVPRSRVKFHMYCKGRDYIATSNLSKSLTGMFTQMSVDMPDLYCSPFNSKSCYNEQNALSRQGFQMHFRMTVYCKCTFAHRYNKPGEIL